MIKKQLIAAFLILSMHSFAQLNKNRVMISGRGNFYSNRSEGEDYSIISPVHLNNKISNGNIDLNVGYFLSNNFAIGGIFGFEKNMNARTYTFTNGDQSIQKSTTQNFSTGIFARYNHMINASKFGLFFQLNNTFGWGRIDGENSYNSNNYPSGSVSLEKNHSFNIGLTPGLMYFITNRLSIETSIGDLSYNSTVTKDKPLELNVRKESNFNANFSASTVYFGLTFYIGGKKSEDTKSAAGESK
jgi:hypothetical protein